MGFNRFTDFRIEVEVPNRVIPGFGEFKRKAYVINVIPNFHEGTITVELLVKWYRMGPDDTYGECIEAMGINTYRKMIFASRELLVDTATGDRIGIIADLNGYYLKDKQGNDTADLNPAHPLFSKNFMIQHEWYFWIAHTQPVVLKNAIAKAVQLNAKAGGLD